MQMRLGPLERTLNRVGEVSGLNSLGRGVDKAANGELIGGGVELVAALPLIPGERVLLSGGKIGSSVAKALGIGRHQLGKSIEAIKKAAGLGGSENVVITSIGNVFNKATGEFLDNVFDVFTKK